MLIIFCVISSILYLIWLGKYETVIAYVRLGEIKKVPEFFIRVGNWVLIFGNFVPISLLVTIETVKFIQAIFIAGDDKMYTAKCDTKVVVQSSNLNEELGQISYVFSDKTGTLTCNEMIFKKCIVNGKAYGDVENQELEAKFPKVENVSFTDSRFLNNLQQEASKLYLKFLAICHMIIVENKGSEIIYNSSSPDEIALANFGKYCGFEFREIDEHGKMVIRINGKDISIKRHYVFEFNSDRKRQSVVFEESNNDIWLYTKGADNIMLERAHTESLKK
jgi:phospholipid-transporting ATPase